MVIQYFGLGFVKASVGDTVVSFAPVAKDGAIKAPSFGADVVLVPMHHPNYAGAENMYYGSKEPVVIEGPGEYETGGIFIRGWATGDVLSGKPLATVYSVRFDEINLCYLGPIAKPELPADVVEGLGDVDILFVPTYGGDTLDESAAHKLASKMGANVVVPLFYGPGASGKVSDTLKSYLKEAGEEGRKPLDKLTIKRKELETKEGEIISIKSF